MDNDKDFIKNPVEAYETLKAENECLKQEFEIESLTDKTTGETIYRSNLVNKYRTILQEIKEIAEGIRNATYQFGQEADQKFFDETLGKILRNISEVEEIE